jgi:hypothetical protein
VAMLYAAGQYANLLSRATTITISPGADSLFPSTNLYDGRPSRPMKFSSNAANPSITWDGNAVSGASPQTIAARAGERRRISVAGTANVSVQNLSTGKYLTSGAAWQAGSTYCLTAAGTLSYTVESLTLCQSPTVSLKITWSASTATDWPQWNAAILFGHNLDVGLTVELRSSTDNFSGSNVLEVTGAILQPAFFMKASATVLNRYGRIALTGTNQATGWLGEVFPCFLETATDAPEIGLEVRLEEPQIRNVGPFGDAYVYPLATRPRRIVQMQFDQLATTGAIETRQEMVLRGRGGMYQMVVVPVSTETDVYLGRLSEKWSETRYISTRYRNDLVLAEDAIPTPLA